MLRTLRRYWSGEVEQQHVVVELVDHGRDLRKIELKKTILGSDMLRTLRSYWSGEVEQQHVVVEQSTMART